MRAWSLLLLAVFRAHPIIRQVIEVPNLFVVNYKCIEVFFWKIVYSNHQPTLIANSLIREFRINAVAPFYRLI